MAGSDELMLLERVFLRIGSADTDEKLENAINKFLPPVLLKLSSKQDGVRKKVMELLVHINKRLKSRPNISIPVETLLQQYQDPESTSFLTNFTIIYIKLGYPRLTPEKQTELMPIILKSLYGKPQAHQDGLLFLIISSLKNLQIPSCSEKRKLYLAGLKENANMLDMFLDFMLDILLLPYGVTTLVNKGPEGSSDNALPPPAFSEYSFKRVTGENPLDPAALEETKLSILKFICNVDLTSDKITSHVVIGCSDTRHSIASFSEMELRKFAPNEDMNNTTVVSKLYSIFLGTIEFKNQKSSVKPELKSQPASTRIRLKILNHFLKTNVNVLQFWMRFPFCIQVIFGCLFGEPTHVKLKVMAVQLIHHLCDSCSNENISPISTIILPGMIRLIEDKECDSKLRGLALIAIGKIGNKTPSLVNSDMLIIQKLFSVLNEEDNDIRMAAQQVLSMLTNVFHNLNAANKNIMEGLIFSYIEKSQYQVRLACVQYADAIFPQDHIPSRYCLLLASGDQKDEVAVGALKALHLKSDIDLSKKSKSEVKFPPFKDIVHFITQKVEERDNSDTQYVSGTKRLPFHPSTYLNILTYLRMCLQACAGISHSTDEEVIQDKIPLIGQYIKALLIESSVVVENPVYKYVNLILQLLEANKDPQSMHYILEVLASAPDCIPKMKVINVELVKSCMYSTQDIMREKASQLLAFIVLQSSQERQIIAQLEELLNNINNNKSLEIQHGSILALGYIIGRIISSKHPVMNTPSYSNIAAKTLNKIVMELDNTSSLIVNACCNSVGEIGRNGPLPLPDGSEENGEEISRLYVVSKFSKMLLSSKVPNKSKEKAALASGLLCVGDVNFQWSKQVIEGLLASGQEIADIDIHFSVGDALVCGALKTTSPHGRNIWNETEEKHNLKFSQHELDEESLSYIIDQIVDKYLVHTKFSIRQASCVWILILLNKCKKKKAMMDRLMKIQNAMLNLLGDRSDIVQEFASKAISILYEYGDEEQKKILVTVLLETITKGKKMKQVFSGETEVFQKGALVTDSTSGESISTYKDLCSIATDLNQPDLVYKFMNLANHNAIWNSRKGAAFGFQSIAVQAGEKLTEHLPKIIPKLYRYMFDPNPKSRLSFINIWNSLVTESQKTVDTYFHEIMAEIIDNLTNNQWRVRESCCVAMNDLLRGRNADLIMEYLPQLWEICLKVRDDIKESVRVAAESSLKTLQKVSLKLCDANEGSDKAISLILPCLIKHGLSNPVQEIRLFSLSTITQLSRKAGKLLSPHLPLLFVALLESLSTEESSAFNMLSVRLESNQESQKKLDSLRIASSKTSPMMETINYCIQFVDSLILPDIVVRLIEMIKHSVGLATKAGSAHVVVSLVHQCPLELNAYAGKIMPALLNGLNDRNIAVRVCFANALGNLVKCSKESSVEKLIIRLQEWYVEKNDKALQDTCALVVQAMLKYSPDVAKSHALQVLPLSFFAMHAPKEDSSANLWEEIWLEMTPGTEAGIKLYLLEILAFTKKGLESQSWQLKAQSGRSLSTVASKLTSNISSSHFDQILRLLVVSLAGRTWSGKETLLQAIRDFVVNCGDSWEEEMDSEMISKFEVVDCMLKECLKENIPYKLEALKATGDIVNKLDIDQFQDIYSIVQPLLNKPDDDDDDEDKKKHRDQINIVSYKVLGNAWPTDQVTQVKYEEEFATMLISKIQSSTWKTQVAILNCLDMFINKWKIKVDNLNVENYKIIVNKIFKNCYFCLTKMKYSAVKLETLKVLDSLIDFLNTENNKLLKDCVKQSMDNITEAIEATKSDTQPNVASKSINLFLKFK